MSSQAQDLIARKNYAKALEVIKAELARRPHDDRLQLQQADVLILAGRNKEAVVALMALADRQAADGFAAKAIAILKRIEKIEPGRRDVEDRLAHLIQEKVRHTPGASRPAAAQEIGLEEFDPSSDQLAVAGAPSLPPIGDVEGLDYVAAVPPSKPFVSTPLFESLSQEDLVALIHGLKLLTFAPGDILVAEGAPGDSLFIITTGAVKAWVRGRKGHYMMVKELTEGDFFGEISVLTGKPRTATITATASCEVLELDRATLDSITQTHPRVREMLKEFHEKRAQDTVEQILRRKS